MAKVKITKEELILKLKGLSGLLDSATDDINEKVVWDQLIDMVEAMIQRSRNKADDLILLPLLKAFRNRYDIPDND